MHKYAWLATKCMLGVLCPTRLPPLCCALKRCCQCWAQAGRPSALAFSTAAAAQATVVDCLLQCKHQLLLQAPEAEGCPAQATWCCCAGLLTAARWCSCMHAADQCPHGSLWLAGCSHQGQACYGCDASMCRLFLPCCLLQPVQAGLCCTPAEGEQACLA